MPEKETVTSEEYAEAYQHLQELLEVDSEQITTVEELARVIKTTGKDLRAVALSVGEPQDSWDFDELIPQPTSVLEIREPVGDHFLSVWARKGIASIVSSEYEDDSRIYDLQIPYSDHPGGVIGGVEFPEDRRVVGMKGISYYPLTERDLGEFNPRTTIRLTELLKSGVEDLLSVIPEPTTSTASS